MSKSDLLRIPDYLWHILEAIERIYRYIWLTQTKKKPASLRGF